jgi:hypothetical protein
MPVTSSNVSNILSKILLPMSLSVNKSANLPNKVVNANPPSNAPVEPNACVLASMALVVCTGANSTNPLGVLNAPTVFVLKPRVLTKKFVVPRLS